jgi:hypothetical protein
MGSRTTMCRADLFQWLETNVRPLVRAFIRKHDAGELVDDLCADEFARHFREGSARFLFESGLTLCGGTSLRCESQQLSRDRELRRRQTRHKRQQALRDEVRTCRLQAREHHLQHLEPTLDKLQKLADASHDLELRDLLRTFSEQDRAEIYEALFKLRLPEQRTARVVVASAEELLVIDPAKPAPPTRCLPVSGPPGPLRSVRLDRGGEGRAFLLAGAKQGAYVLDAAGSQSPKAFCLPDCGGRRLQGGVNSVTLSGGELLASHSEVGLVHWRLDDPDSAEPLLAEQTRNAEAVRHVRRIGDSVWVTIDHRILRLPADDLRAEAAVCYEAGAIVITALCVGPDRVLAGTQTGQVLAWDLDDPSGPQILEHGRGRPVGSVQMLPGGGLERLVFADCSAGVVARFVDDVFACRYQGAGQEIRWSFAAEDLLAGVNVQRDRLLLWHSYQPAEPYAVLPLAQVTGHSIQDVCFIPQSAVS